MKKNTTGTIEGEHLIFTLTTVDYGAYVVLGVGEAPYTEIRTSTACRWPIDAKPEMVASALEMLASKIRKNYAD